MTSTIQVRVDEELKEKSENLFKELGTDTTTAIRMFLTQAIQYNGFPFEIRKNTEQKNPYSPMSEKEIQNKLDSSRIHASQGKIKPADDAISEMRAKYGI